nr:immunoglobulin heavy chain junction region [Macaca mulatta]MOV89214.1 immunoglobulin heavy chain junction region [Macaca mulatta]MOV89269.1 immunoglobulin heavy chain junction region [Macaca mulatta]MOV89427.1 immunoglobulin heavy chain junction region [Macaca mulatta]MOV89804.1 immunoglobulin heavy chain junction region [Macaca mulatta]
CVRSEEGGTSFDYW